VARPEKITSRGNTFPTQAPIGTFVVDFFCPAARLFIEIDGGHHSEDQNIEKDRKRQLWLEQEGYRVIRFWNSEIANNLTAVLERIYVEVHGSRDAPTLPLKHHRQRSGITTPRPQRGRPSPSRGG
jgi:very-short-patch-repair endonuclease